MTGGRPGALTPGGAVIGALWTTLILYMLAYIDWYTYARLRLRYVHALTDMLLCPTRLQRDKRRIKAFSSARLAHKWCRQKNTRHSLWRKNKTGIFRKINYRSNCAERLQRGRRTGIRKHVKHWRIQLFFPPFRLSSRKRRNEY